MVTFFELLVIAACMTAVLVTVIRWYPRVDSQLKLELLFFILIMMVSMFIGASFFLAYPSALSLTYVVGGNMAVMVLGLVFILRNMEVDAQLKIFDSSQVTLYFSIILVLNEALMGFVFKEAQTGFVLNTGNALRDLIALVNISVNTYWFFTPIMLEMIFALTLIKKRPRMLNVTYFGVVGATALPPTLIPIPQWENIGFFFTLFILLWSLYSGRGVFKASDRRGIIMVMVLTVCLIFSYLSKYWVVYAAAILITVIWFYNDVFKRKHLELNQGLSLTVKR